MSDVTAVILTIGEGSTSRAIDSVRAQTHPVRDTIIVENVSPFHRALNEAARRVTTPFFVQVDADMILDADCVARLRAAVQPDTGIAVGELRDALMGQVVGIKLFRTDCIRRIAMPDTISPDTDLVTALDRAGWRTVFIEGPESLADPSEPRPTLGDHRPDYAPEYTYRKFLLEGRRCRYRGATGALQWRLHRLDHVARTQPDLAEIADVAQVGTANGFYYSSERDELAPLTGSEGYARVIDSIRAGDNLAGQAELHAGERLRDVFRRFTVVGESLARGERREAFRSTLRALYGSRNDWNVTVAKIALCRGFFSPDADTEARSGDERALRDFVTLRLGSRSASARARAQVARLVNLHRGRAWVRW